MVALRMLDVPLSIAPNPEVIEPESNAPTDTRPVAVVIEFCVAVATVPVMLPTKAVDVILVAPVTTPASILIVPSSKIAEPEAGSILIAAPESKVNTPAELISTVPSAVIV